MSQKLKFEPTEDHDRWLVQFDAIRDRDSYRIGWTYYGPDDTSEHPEAGKRLYIAKKAKGQNTLDFLL